MKFFFIKNRIEYEEMRVVNCSTERMWTDVLTKLLQGTAFRKKRAKLMNCDEIYEDNKRMKEDAVKAKSVSGKVAQRGSTQNLLKCVGRSSLSQQSLREDRKVLGKTDDQSESQELPAEQRSREESKSCL